MVGYKFIVITKNERLKFNTYTAARKTAVVLDGLLFAVSPDGSKRRIHIY